MTDPEIGARVVTSDGLEGVVLEERVHEALYFYDWSGTSGRGKRQVIAYPVLLDSGEVRFYAAAALNEPVRRYGSLEP